MTRDKAKSRTIAFAFAAFVLTLALAQTAGAKKEKPVEVTHDGLHLVPGSEVALAYVKPEADFSIYERVMILEPYVAFKKGWERDHRGGTTLFRVSKKDMEEIKTRMAKLFREVFEGTLAAGDGYPVVRKADDDVLLLRPAIIDLDFTAPDVDRPARSRVYTSSAGAATLYIELYDSVSGEILARAIDRQAGRDSMTFQHSTRVNNSTEAQRALSKWARLLRQRLDEIHGKTPVE
ncbi:MAG: DUF3313 domain-containing protein [Acidobacteriota bacterium]|nr:DUF3313 domain-containing protein [Acidobacteriota bacterium]